MKKITFVLIASTTLFLNIANLNLAHAGKIVKWVDSNGVTQYGDKLPAEYAGRKNTEINDRGVVTKQNNLEIDPTSEADTQQKTEQARRDKILLASYSNANEIDLARDRSLEMDKAALTSLTAQKENITSRIVRNNQTVDAFKKRNKPLPVNLETEFKEAVAQSARIDKQMADRKLAMEITKKNYAADKERFIALKQVSGASIAAPTHEVTSSVVSESSKTGTQK
jgi:Domain of unknown function (DUF4124)